MIALALIAAELALYLLLQSGFFHEATLLMTDVEIAIYHYLKSQSGQFTPAIDISRRVDKRRFSVNPQWALKVLPQMVERGILESDGSDAFRVASALLEKIAKERKNQRWLAPHIRRIFETCRKDLSRTITLDDPELNILISL